MLFAVRLRVVGAEFYECYFVKIQQEIFAKERMTFLFLTNDTMDGNMAQLKIAVSRHDMSCYSFTDVSETCFTAFSEQKISVLNLNAASASDSSVKVYRTA
jgi:hypothetical protein